MPKKISKRVKANNDFHFIVIISVFAALTIFAANYMAQTAQKAAQARQSRPLPISQLEIVTPTPTASVKPTTKPKATPRPTAYPTTRPWN